MFTDKVKVHLAAGKGGNGVVAWRREKYIPKGGPSGGNGGRGGSIIFQADTQVYSLDALRNRRILKAENGNPGGSNNKQGRTGKNLIIKVPCGTLVKDIHTGEILRDITEDGDEWEICKGGRGGRGNDSFKTPTNRAPNICTPGQPGEEIEVELELKLIADVGLVGFPNAGKSTIINALTYVKVKIAPYPFTTLQPNLGYLQTEDYQRILIADIPGIIENAHQNRGLGFEFLRHIERTSLLIFVLDASGMDGRNPTDDFRVLQEELKAYNPELLERPSLVVLNKIDLEESEHNIEEFRKNYSLPKSKLFEISATEGKGVAAFRKALEKKMKKK